MICMASPSGWMFSGPNSLLAKHMGSRLPNRYYQYVTPYADILQGAQIQLTYNYIYTHNSTTQLGKTYCDVEITYVKSCDPRRSRVRIARLFAVAT